MSCSPGVVIQPSACRAIQASVLRAAARADDQRHVRLGGLGEGPAGAELSRTLRRRPPPRCVQSARIASMYSRSTVRRLPAGTPWSASSSVFQPNPAPTVTRPPDRWSSVAIVFASVIGSDSTGRATAVPSLIRDVTAAAVASETHGIEGAQIAVVGQRRVAGARVGGLPLDRDVGVLGHVERVESAFLGRLGRLRGGDAAIGGEQDDAVAHGIRLERVPVHVTRRRTRRATWRANRESGSLRPSPNSSVSCRSR